MTAWKATRPLWSVTTHAGHAMQSAPFTPSVMLLVSLLLLSHTPLLPSWLFYALSISSQTLFSFYLPSISAKLQWPILALTVSCCALRLHPSFALLCVVPFALLLLLALPLPGGSANSSTCTLLLSNGSPHQASSFSPLSSIKAHIEWSRLARSRGQTPQELAKSIKDDTDFHWDLPPCDTEGEALPLDPTQRESRRAKPEIGEVIRSWDRIVVWDADCVPFAVLESWRSLLDPVADAAVRAFLGTSSKSDPAPASCDPLTALAHLHLSSSVPSPQSARVDAAPSSAASAFFRDACRRPPRGAGAVSEAWYAAQAKGRGPTEKLDLLQQHSESCENVLPSIRAEQARGNHRQVLGPHEGIANADELQEELRVIAAGQDFFHRHGPPLLVSLLHAGLAGGFASPRIRRVLNSTGYLMNPASSKGSTKGGVPVSQASKDRTFRRLLETTEWILDVMEDVEALHLPTEVHAPQRDAAAWLQTAGKGWLSTSRVRLLHSSVRVRMARAHNAQQEQNQASSALDAINQEDLLATLCSFAIVPLWSLQSMGLPPTMQEREDYVSLWRHVGFYVGIEPELLRRCFGTVSKAERCFYYIASHHFLHVAPLRDLPPPPPLSKTGGAVPQEGFKGPALPLLYSTSNRAPSNMSFASHLAIARYLMGPSLATALCIPATSHPWGSLRVNLSVLILILPPLFARSYGRHLRPSWGNRLRDNARVLLRRVTLWNLQKMGKGRAKFQPPPALQVHPSSTGVQVPNLQTALHATAEKAQQEIVLDQAAGEKMREEYHSLMAEMGIVLLMTCLSSLLLVFFIARHGLIRMWA